LTESVPRSFHVTVKPEVLRWARESAGVPVEWAAQRCGRTVETIEAWESGIQPPTFAALRTLSRLYGQPMSVLLLAEPPREPEAPPDRRSLAGARPRPLGYASRGALREARRLQRLAADLYESFRMRVLLPRGSVELDADVEALAMQERERLGVDLDEQMSWRGDYEAWWAWRAAVENLNVLVLQFSIPVRELRGFALSGDGGPPTIGVTGKDTVRPRMFTLLHEYAHLLLDAASLCSPSPDSRTRMQLEAFANEFAGAVLVPLDSLMAHEASHNLIGMDAPPPDEALRPLTGDFLVTKYVIWERLRKANLISPEVHSAKWRQWRAALEEWTESEGGRTTRAESAVSSRGPRFVTLLLQAERQGLLEYADLPRYLGQRLSHLEEIELRANELRVRG